MCREIVLGLPRYITKLVIKKNDDILDNSVPSQETSAWQNMANKKHTASKTSFSLPCGHPHQALGLEKTHGLRFTSTSGSWETEDQ